VQNSTRQLTLSILISTGPKRCPKCGEHKGRDQFGRAKHTTDGLAGWCRDCMRTAVRQSWAKHGDKYREAKRLPPRPCQHCDQAEVAPTRRWCANCVKLRPRANLLKQYGMTLEDYEDMAEAQGQRCAICTKFPERLVVDHCHQTGIVRGLLCGNCNLALGKFGDTTQGLMRAVEYLEGRHTDLRAFRGPTRDTSASPL